MLTFESYCIRILIWDGSLHVGFPVNKKSAGDDSQDVSILFMYAGVSAFFPYTQVLLLAGITVVVCFASPCGCNKTENMPLWILFSELTSTRLFIALGTGLWYILSVYWVFQSGITEEKIKAMLRLLHGNMIFQILSFIAFFFSKVWQWLSSSSTGT